MPVIYQHDPEISLKLGIIQRISVISALVMGYQKAITVVDILVNAAGGACELEGCPSIVSMIEDTHKPDNKIL